MPQTLALIDANGYIHRAFHALARASKPLTNSQGEPTGALFGFAKMILKILRENHPDRVAVCFDTPAPTFRHKAYDQYKAHRKETDPDLKFQLPLAREMVEAWGLPVFAKDGYEADDLIATLAQAGADARMRVTVVTGDKDAMQLVNDRISVLNEQRGVTYDADEVEKRYGLTPAQMVDYFALTGDASDNVPGVPGVGEKTATQLLQTYKTLDGVYKHLDEIKGALQEKLRANKKMAEMSRSLVILDRRVPLGRAPGDCVPAAPTPRLAELLKRFEFNSLLAEMGADLPAGAAKAAAPARRPLKAHVVQKAEDLKGLVKALKGASVLSVDVETTGTDALSCALVGISLAASSGEAWYIPVGHRYIGAPPQLPLAEVRKSLGTFLADPGLPKVGQNLKFDGQVLERHGMPLAGIAFDTLVASYCLNPGRQTHGLKQLALDLLGETMTPIETLIGTGAKQITMDQVEILPAAQYAAADADVPLRLKTLMEKELRQKKMEKLFHDVEMPLVTILSDMEKTGVAVDLPYLKKLSREFTQNIAALEKDIHKLAGESFNVNSPKQLAVLLFEKLKLPVVRRTKTGYSTDEDVLRKLSDKHPLPAKIVGYRELSKLKSTYIDGLLEEARPDTGRVHTRFNQAVAATGRLSSSDPNLQNIPIRTEEGRRIRRAFVPSQGCVFLSADYSQIDLRVLAHVSGDPALAKAFRRGEDIHAATARDIFGLGADESVTEEQRRIAKSVNFGIVYGQTSYGLSQQLGIPFEKAQSYINNYFEKYAGVKTWVESTLAKARKEGFVTTLLNRVRYLPEINASNGNVRAFAERTAMNTPIQGTSADIIKVAMIDIARLLRDKKWKTRMLLQVHDDLLFDVPAAELKAAAPLIKKTMEDAVRLDVPVKVDLKTGDNWADMGKYA